MSEQSTKTAARGSERGTIRAMTNEDPRIERGKALERALEERRPDMTQNRLLSEAGLSAPTWKKVITGAAAISSYEAIEEAIREWDENPDDRESWGRERGAGSPGKEAGAPGVPFTIEVKGVFGIESVTFSGPPTDAEAIQQAAIEFVRKARDVASPDQ
jgi:hypothetical protein